MKAVFNRITTIVCCMSIVFFSINRISAVDIIFRLKPDASKALKKNVGGTPQGIAVDTNYSVVKFEDGKQLTIHANPNDQLSFLYKAGISTWEASIGTAEELVKKYGTDITITHITRTGGGMTKTTNVTMEATQK